MNFRRSKVNAAAVIEARLSDLSDHECIAVAGGMKKLPFQTTSTGNLLTSPDGEPVSVYVDGVLINSVRDGFVHL